MMTAGQIKYDDSKELGLNSLLCSLDENPTVCVNPVDASTYMGFTLAGTDKSFHRHIKENLFDPL